MFHPSFKVAQNYKILRLDSRCTSRQHDLQQPDEEESVNHEDAKEQTPLSA